MSSRWRPAPTVDSRDASEPAGPSQTRTTGIVCVCVRERVCVCIRGGASFGPFCERTGPPRAAALRLGRACGRWHSLRGAHPHPVGPRRRGAGCTGRRRRSGRTSIRRVHPRQRAEAAEGVDMFLYTGPGRAGSVSRMLSGTRRESALARSLRWARKHTTYGYKNGSRMGRISSDWYLIHLRYGFARDRSDALTVSTLARIHKLSRT